MNLHIHVHILVYKYVHRCTLQHTYNIHTPVPSTEKKIAGSTVSIHVVNMQDCTCTTMYSA